MLVGGKHENVKIADELQLLLQLIWGRFSEIKILLTNLLNSFTFYLFLVCKKLCLPSGNPYNKFLIYIFKSKKNDFSRSGC